MKDNPAAPADREPKTTAHDIEALHTRLDQRLGLEASEPPVEPPPGYQADGKGRLVPRRLVRPADDLEDATVRRILAFGADLADQISRFRQHSYADVGALLDVLAEEYGAAKRPGRKGNFSLTSYDGRLRVQIQVQDRIAWGPSLQIARRLVDQLIAEWSDGVRAELVALVQSAFEPDTEGRISREAVFRLRRVEIDDPRWRKVCEAINDAIQVVGTRAYLRMYLRGSVTDPWKPVPIDLSSDWVDTGEMKAAGSREKEN